MRLGAEDQPASSARRRGRGAAAAAGEIGAFDDEKPRAFAEVQAPAAGIERPAKLRIDRREGVEPRERETAEAVRPARDDGVDLPGQKPRGGDDEHVRAARARARERADARERPEDLVQTVRRCPERMCEQAAKPRVRRVGSQAVPTGVGMNGREELLVFEHSTRRARDDEPDPRASAHLEPRPGDRLARGFIGHLRGPRPPGLSRERSKPIHLGPELRAVPVRREALDGANPALAANEAPPRRLDADTERRHEADACDVEAHGRRSLRDLLRASGRHVARERPHRTEDAARLVALGDLHPEPLFDAHGELERVERVEPEPLPVLEWAEERRVVVDRLRLPALEVQLLHEEPFQFLAKLRFFHPKEGRLPRPQACVTR